MRSLLVLVALLAAAPRAEADDLRNYLVGPVFGIRLGGHDGPRGVIGLEGGVGAGPERINLGFEYRDDKMFWYGEVDPWYVVGLSLGFGVDSDGEQHGVVGVWEGLPLVLPSCGVRDSQLGRAVTVAAGYRWTGVHELYVTIKAGKSQPFCLDGD